MLILARKDGESILIGDNIKIKVIESYNGLVRLGFEAPNDVVILREEVADAIKDANIKATKSVSKESLKSLKDKLK